MLNLFEFAKEEGFTLTPQQETYLMGKFSNKEFFVYIDDIEKEVADKIYCDYMKVLEEQ